MNAILGMAKGYDWRHIRPLVVSARKAGFDGHIVMLGLDGGALTREQCDKHNVWIVPCEQADFPETAGWPLVCWRFAAYHKWLIEHAWKYEYLMLADTRDVLIQRDPFADEPKGICAYLEDSSMTLRSCPYNSEWLRRWYGTSAIDTLGDNRISCAGTVLGEAGPITGYVGSMLDAMQAIKPVTNATGPDQAAHNVLIHTGAIENLRVFDNDNRTVQTVGYMPVVSRNDNGLVVNPDCEVVAVVHQYDRPRLNPLAQELLGVLA
jgi:hypothetical protein